MLVLPRAAHISPTLDPNSQSKRLYFKPALPRLSFALINSHLHQHDEARAAGTSWQERPYIAHRKIENVLLFVKLNHRGKRNKGAAPVSVLFTVAAVATEEGEDLGFGKRLGGESGIIDPGDMATIISHLIVD